LLLDIGSDARPVTIAASTRVRDGEGVRSVRLAEGSRGTVAWVVPLTSSPFSLSFRSTAPLTVSVHTVTGELIGRYELSGTARRLEMSAPGEVRLTIVDANR
jgi:hypothetical protein